MVFIPKWDRFSTLQPVGECEIDYSNPLTEKLVFVKWGLQTIAGDKLVNPVYVANIPTKLVETDLGSAVVIDAEYYYVTYDVKLANASTSNNYTIAANLSANYTNTEFIFTLHDYPSNNNPLCGFRSTGTQGQLEVYYRTSTYSTDTLTVATPIFGNYCNHVFTTSRTARAFYGLDKATSTVDIGADGLGAAKFTFYGRAGYNTTRANLGLVALWERTLTDDEVREYKQYPWQVLRQRPKIFLLPANTNIELILQNLSVTQNINNIALIQQNTLSSNNLSQEQTLTSPVLVQQNILVNNSLTQAQTVDDFILTQNNIISLQGISTIQQLTNADLVQQNILVMDNISQTNILSSLALLMSAILELQSISETVNYTNLDLVQQNLLVVDNITETNLLSTITLIQQNVLNINSILETVNIDNIGLSQNNILTLEHTQSTSNLSNITLSTTPLLNINNLNVTSTLSTINLTSSSILIVDALLHSIITSNLKLSLGGLLIEGNFIYILGKNSNIYVIRDKKDIYMIN